MPRRARVVLSDVPMHIIQRGNNKSPCFYCEDDYRCYLDWLKEYAFKTKCQIHAYVLMTNHVHLLASCKEENGIARLMKLLGQRYVQHINRTYRRTGTLWEGRFRSSLIQEETYLLVCQRYIELNPVRAKMVEHPGEYQWGSYRANGQGEENGLISPHSCYLALGENPHSRQERYRELFKDELEPTLVDNLRQATNGNYALGDTRFTKQIADMLGRRVTSGGKGGRTRIK